MKSDLKEEWSEMMELILNFLPFIAIMALMYFMMIRPQKKAATKTQDMLSAMKKGDAIVTIGGLHGVIDEVNTTNNTIVIDCDGIFLTFEKKAIARVVTNAVSTPVEDLGTNTPPHTLDENTDEEL